MKISAVPSLGNTVGSIDGQAARVDSIRSFKMATNATPGPSRPPGAQELSILDDNSNKEESTAIVEATQPLSPQLAAIAKQRRALQQERRAFEEEKKAQEAGSQGSDLIPKARLKSETLKVLQEAGITYDDLTQAILAGQGNSELSALEAKIAALEQGVEKKFTERETREEQQLYSEVTRDAESIIAAKADDFELIKKMDRVPTAIEIWKKEFKETGKFPDIEGILKDVEDYCLKECQEFTGLKKIQALFPQQAPEPQPRSQGMRTLTNKDTASVPMSAKARAMAAFYGTLKK